MFNKRISSKFIGVRNDEFVRFSQENSQTDFSETSYRYIHVSDSKWLMIQNFDFFHKKTVIEIYSCEDS